MYVWAFLVIFSFHFTEKYILFHLWKEIIRCYSSYNNYQFNSKINYQKLIYLLNLNLIIIKKLSFFVWFKIICKWNWVFWLDNFTCYFSLLVEQRILIKIDTSLWLALNYINCKMGYWKQLLFVLSSKCRWQRGSEQAQKCWRWAEERRRDTDLRFGFQGTFNASSALEMYYLYNF